VPTNLEQQAAEFSRQQQEQFANPATTGNNTFMPGYRAVSQQPVAVDTPQTNQSYAYRALDNVQNSIDQINSMYAANLELAQQQAAPQLNAQSFDVSTPESQNAALQYSSGIPVGGTGTGKRIDYSTLSDSRQKLLGKAQSYLGSPYVLGGTTKEGIDCSGLVMNVYNKAGFDVGQHSATWQGQNIPGVRTTIDNLRPGDLVAWRDGSHIAIYAGNGQIIEAANPAVGTVQRKIWADPSQLFGIKVRLPGDRNARMQAEAAAVAATVRNRPPTVADRMSRETIVNRKPNTSANARTAI
jgi:cell wall-associated NlpC family hydrolase